MGLLALYSGYSAMARVCGMLGDCLDTALEENP